ncbi:MAG: hypothetical protein WKF30_14815 [Pyrinomonadaceae bacterium]
MADFSNAKERGRIFRDDLGVSKRVSLYRYLLEEPTALDEHRRMKKARPRDGRNISPPRTGASACAPSGKTARKELD